MRLFPMAPKRTTASLAAESGTVYSHTPLRPRGPVGSAGPLLWVPQATSRRPQVCAPCRSSGRGAFLRKAVLARERGSFRLRADSRSTSVGPRSPFSCWLSWGVVLCVWPSPLLRGAPATPLGHRTIQDDLLSQLMVTRFHLQLLSQVTAVPGASSE